MKQTAAPTNSNILSPPQSLADGDVFKVIFDDLDVSLCVTDPAGVVLFLNRSCAALFGMNTIEEGCDENGADSRLVTAALRANAHAVLMTGAAQEREVVLSKGNAPERTYLTYTVPVQDEAGHVFALRGTWTDITERKRADIYIRRVELLAAVLSSALVPDQVIGVMAGRGVEAAGACAGSVVMPTSDREDAQEQAVDALPLAVSEGVNLAALADRVAEAARDRKARFFSAGEVNAYLSPFLEQDVVAATVDRAIIPLVAMGKTIGVWVLRFGDGLMIGPAEQELISTLAAEGARALERACLFEAEREQMRRESTDLLTQMRDNDQRLRLALQAGKMGTWELDLHTGGMVCSEETGRLVGMSPDRALMRVENILERIHADDVNEVLRSLEQCVERRQNCESEFRVRLPNGDVRWISLRGEVLRDEAGAALRLIGVMADVSARKQTEEARRTAEQERYWLMREAQSRAAELVAVIESMPEALLIGNEALVTLANRPALDLFGCETVDELNQDAAALAERALVREVNTGEQMPPDQWPFQRALAGEARVQDLIVHHAKLGHDVVLRCTATPIRVSTIPMGAVCVFADLARSRQQTLIRNLIEAQEEERRAVAYELHDGLTQYIMAAHAHLESFSHLLPRAAQNEPASREFEQGITYLDQAVTESRRLINGLRALALDDLGLAGALEQTLNEEKERAGWHEAEWTHNIPGRRYPKILETAVYRVAQEALTNARKHARASRVCLLLMADMNDSGEPVLSLEVRDWGRGFLPEETTTQYGHLGLQGMFERVNLAGGSYYLHSAPGKGTMVRAVFPAAASPREAADRG